MYSIGPALQCKFFVAPAEIRRTIYGNFISDQIQIHLVLDEKRLRSTACKDGNPDCLQRQFNVIRGSADSIYELPLCSPWAHIGDVKNWQWECERMIPADKPGRFIDVGEEIAGTVPRHINDLDTLGILDSHWYSSSIHLHHVFPSLQELNISLRLPLETYVAIENAGNSTGSELSSTRYPISAWMELCFVIKRLSTLRRLDIWLNHNEPCSWTMIKERAALSPVMTLPANQNLDINIDLSLLHPKQQTPERHSTERSLSLPLNLRRRHRQRYHAVEVADGRISEESSPDFPELYELTK
ncbi:hypothetical protein BCR34DRAFT_635853 [Clohesyomyces aquaticus]|uniref:Uncharacterized protein n=1 Tax=Clohesyomyces aquaticus TaxID=1231657 RepID=A0A1Y1YXJ2_9PLEO|nr:hypothetical protein BCR34DRAFT_635853 [Clohesyomyces aquaticus]